MRVFIYIGSFRGEKSKTAKVADMFVEKLRVMLHDEDIIVDKYMANTCSISECIGCCNCFKTGRCPLEQADDMPEIKEKMKLADLIIWGSPSYAHNVSSHMKKFIDRISGWFHYLNLAGKLGISISTSSASGNEYVIDYLSRMFMQFGAYVVGSLDGYDDDKGFYDKIIDEKRVENLAKQTIDVYKSIGIKKMKIPEYQELIFSSYKNDYSKVKEYADYVYEIGKWFEVYDEKWDDFEDFFVGRFNKRRGNNNE